MRDRFFVFMEQQWFFNLLEKAKEEIKVLRAENKLMAARLEIFDNMMSVFNAQKVQHGYTMTPDIVYDIEKVITEFKGTTEKEQQCGVDLNGDGLTAMSMQDDRVRRYTRNDRGHNA